MPPAFDTATTTSRQCEKASSGNSMSSRVQMGDCMTVSGSWRKCRGACMSATVDVSVKLICRGQPLSRDRSEEHTSELQSLMRSSYAVFCLKKKKHEQ